MLNHFETVLQVILFCCILTSFAVNSTNCGITRRELIELNDELAEASKDSAISKTQTKRSGQQPVKGEEVIRMNKKEEENKISRKSLSTETPSKISETAPSRKIGRKLSLPKSDDNSAKSISNDNNEGGVQSRKSASTNNDDKTQNKSKKVAANHNPSGTADEAGIRVRKVADTNNRRVNDDEETQDEPDDDSVLWSYFKPVYQYLGLQ